ncbi:MAG: glycyl-radical enzyme activating protein [Ignavibacteriales bacterium]
MPAVDDDLATRGMVFDIERFAVHDGPGIRSLVFFKGCPLRCLWCSNPEGQSNGIQIGFARGNCIDCGKCADVCPAEAISASDQRIDRDRCVLCGACAAVCPSAALTMIGEEKSVADVLSVVKRDNAFYRRSGGGVTISGGEPLAQWRFLGALLRALKAEHTTTAIETSGFSSETVIGDIVPLVDLVLLDIKHMDDARHREGTGVSNSAILRNARFVAASGSRMVVRIPVIPGYNDSTENIALTAEFARGIGVKEIHLLPYHRLGLSKYAKLGMTYRLPDLAPPPRDHLASLARVVSSAGLVCSIGGM